MKESHKNKYEWLLKLVLMLFFLWLFLLSIKLLGDVFKHYFSDNTADLIRNATDNPLVAFFIGLLTTAIIQSSSSTTSILVAFVGAGTISFENAIPMVMGANIGTSVTGIIVSFGQVKNKLEFHRSFAAAVVHDNFNWFSVLLFLPLEIATGFIGKSAKYLTELFVGSSGVKFESPLDLVVKSISKMIEHFMAGLFGNPIAEHVIAGKASNYPVYDGLLLTVMIILSLALLFVSLNYMSSIMKKILIGKFERIIHKFVFNNMITSFLFGLIFTVSVQSSSVTISLIVPLVGAGILSLEQIFPYAVGANIGTTITGILAAMVTGNPSGISIALAHTLFNIFGAMVFIPFKKLPISTAKWFSYKVRDNRLWAVVFLLVMFFVIPLIFIFI
ncbi:MAG: Na/Pi symporter [Candidatus Delongbacteria bacterium]|nr:Na/Pi symporter [Candidatus Delongbacteria bacterium]MCG2760365.1 Na/Pi symporter [Candidatus Delongbacteria bacterium]